MMFIKDFLAREPSKTFVVENLNDLEVTEVSKGATILGQCTQYFPKDGFWAFSKNTIYIVDVFDSKPYKCEYCKQATVQQIHDTLIDIKDKNSDLNQFIEKESTGRFEKGIQLKVTFLAEGACLSKTQVESEALENKLKKELTTENYSSTDSKNPFNSPLVNPKGQPLLNFLPPRLSLSNRTDSKGSKKEGGDKKK